jgi:hypothetical protein
VISTPEHADSPAPTAAGADPSRLGRWARRRARQTLNAIAILAAAALLTAAGLMLWRASRLFGLPDVGDPFDAAAFRAQNTLPEDQDAMVLIRQAEAGVSPMPALPLAVIRLARTGGWSKADPKIREWLELNRAALQHLRTGVERPDGIVHSGVLSGSSRFLNLSPLVTLAVLEGSRLEALGDMEGAWDWYRTVLRLQILVMQRGSVFQRFVFDRQCERLQPHVESWAASSKTGVPALRRAMADILAGEPRPEWNAYSLKIDYLGAMHDLSDPDGWIRHGSDQELDYRVFGEPVGPNLASKLHAARRFLLNEPELSRRVLRLTFANWLAHTLDSDPGHKKPSVVALSKLDKQTTLIPLFTAPPEAPASARRMPPDELARWLLATRDARWILYQWAWPAVRSAEKRAHASLVMVLAAELYRRDHGKLPPTDKALVGPYLDRLPDDGSGELHDGSTPRVSEATRVDVQTPN